MPNNVKAQWSVYARWGAGITAAAILVALAVEASGRDAPTPPSEPEASLEAAPTKSVAARPDLPAPNTGPGIDQTGAVMIARPGREPGVIEVEERILLPDSPDSPASPASPEGTGSPRTVTVRAPRADRGVPDSGIPHVSALQASSKDGLVPVPQANFTARDGALELVVPGREVVLRYAISGAVGRSPQSLPGRSLVSLKALTADHLDAHPVVTYFYGTVTNVQCADAQTRQQNCGLSQSGRWATVPRPATSSRVVVQFQDTLTP